MTPLQSETSSCKGDGAELRRALQKAGWRFTRQRQAIHSYLCSVDCHPTALQVYLAVRPRLPHISLATVYKGLEALVDVGVAAKIADAEGPARYDCRHDSHYHFRCLDTGQVHDLATPFDPELLDKLDPQLVTSLHEQGFEVTGYRLELLGHIAASPTDASAG